MNGHGGLTGYYAGAAGALALMIEDAEKDVQDEVDRIEEEQAQEQLAALLAAYAGSKPHYTLEDYDSVALDISVNANAKLCSIVKVPPSLS